LPPKVKIQELSAAGRTFSRASPVRKALLVVGSVAFIAGIMLFAAGGYALLSAGDDGRPRHAILDAGTDLNGIYDRAANLSPPTPAPTAEPAPGNPPLADLPYRLLIPKLNVNAPVATYGLDENAVPEVPVGPDAREVVAWYNFSAQPGIGSNAVFAGHVTWHGPAVFYNLGNLEPGDEITLEGEDGTRLVYTVSKVFLVDPEDPNSLSVMSATDYDAITLITCDGDYTATGDPVFGGEYSHRLIVRAARAPAAAGG
jgi:LPXTG-site transpeptidase (sortase) family protein